jgi:FHA domain
MTTDANTKFDLASAAVVFYDEVVQLREWGTNIVHPLPRPPATSPMFIGADRDCSIRLVDRSGRVSRLHAELIRNEDTWLLRDLLSTNGVFLYGVRTTEVLLSPGDEIGIGHLTLIAESRRLIELRSYLSRLLGWDPHLIEVVDLALRSIRFTAAGRVPLVLCGEDDLVPIARSLHKRVVGGDRPFVVCDPAHCQVNDPVAWRENYDQGIPALAAAAGGTLCVRHEHLPFDFPELAAALRQPDAEVLLMVCARSTKYSARYLALPIAIPPLGERLHELDRVIEEYTRDAYVQLDVSEPSLAHEDQQWVRRHASSSIAVIEKATLRLAALRVEDNIGAAAARLGMSSIALSRWLEQRKVPMNAACACCTSN